jgi:anhydro-N-acetylmuramic acid kinase
MSGTSADGIDVAIVRITSPSARGIKLLHRASFKYPKALRAAVLAAMDAKETSTAELARLNWRLGIGYADAARESIAEYGDKVDLIGCHGQTLYHQGIAAPYAGKRIACTWQLGEMAMVSAVTGVPVVSNFRPADMAVGGQGAPLVPYLDYAMFRSDKRNRVLQNLGGIGNLTAIPAGANAHQLIAFDTGPANMIIDALMQKLYRKPYDRNGKIAAQGSISKTIVDEAMRHPFFKRSPPKSAGREQFGEPYADDFLKKCRDAKLGDADIIATATAFTVESIRLSFESFVLPILKKAPTDYSVAGGGAYNETIMRTLSTALKPFGVHVSTLDTFGIPSQSKEAVAFALLAYQTWHHQPSNVPAATGAHKPAILGQVIYCA